MIAVFGAGHDHVDALVQDGHKMSEQLSGHARHVAREHEHHVVARVGEGGVKAAEWAAPRHAVVHAAWQDVPTADTRGGRGQIGRPIVTVDKAHVVGQRCHGVQLPIENAASPDDERALVAAAQAGGEASGQNRHAHRGGRARVRRHVPAILPSM